MSQVAQSEERNDFQGLIPMPKRLGADGPPSRPDNGETSRYRDRVSRSRLRWVAGGVVKARSGKINSVKREEAGKENPREKGATK